MIESKQVQPGTLTEFIRIVTTVAGPYHEPRHVVARRRIVVVVVLVAGAVLLSRMHSLSHGGSAFSWFALGLAVVWGAGALMAGPLHLGSVVFRGRRERPVFTGTGVGLQLGGVFVLAALVVRKIPVLCRDVVNMLEFTTATPWWLLMLIVLVSAISEEMFFRGALYSSFGRHHPMVLSTLLYVAAVLAAGNLMLGAAALVLGTVCAVERRATGGVLASVLTHLVWGLIMVLALPPIFGM